MMSERYDLLMEEMDKIAAKVDLFPESVQESVFQVLIGALGERDALAPDSGATGPATGENSIESEVSEIDTSDEEAQYVTMVKQHASEFNLAKITHPQFAVYGAYVYDVLVPDCIAAEEIGSTELETLYTIVGRKPPANLSNQFNAAKKKLKYLTGGKVRGTFKLTAQGRFYVEHELLVSSE